MRYYKQIDFSKRTGIDRHTIAKWKKNGKLIPQIDENGREFYSEDQAKLFDEVHYGGVIKKDSNWIDLSNIPKEKIRDRLDWDTAALQKRTIEFCYKGESGILRVLENKDHTLMVEYRGKEESICVSSLTNISLAKIIGSFSREYKYRIGENVLIGKTDITILEQIRNKQTNRRAYKYICNKCKQEGSIDEYNISDKGSCPVCIGRKVVHGINDIATTAPWMVPYFKDKTMVFKYTHSSKVKTKFVCPDCGRERKKASSIDTLYRTKSIGCICGDGYSYPNKFMYSVLEQLQMQKKIVSFVKEFQDSWTEGRKYDFKVILLGQEKEIIIEMDGSLGHGNKVMDSGTTPEETKEIDEWKDVQALNHGYKVFRIESLQSEKIYLKSNITKELGDLLDLKEVDWNAADIFALFNYVKMICEYYEKNKPITTKQVGEIFSISPSTVLAYIKRGECYGWCSYDWDSYFENRSALFKQQSAVREKKVEQVCEYYENNKPILASEIAKVFGICTSTVLQYLKSGEELEYEPYDREYSKKCNKEQIRALAGNPRKCPVNCFKLNGEFVKRYESITSAAKAYGVSVNALRSCCEREGTSANHIFRYEKDDKMPVNH